MKKRVTTNDYVAVTYEGMLKNGEIFESSDDIGPLTFKVGSNNVMAGFEKGVLGMAENETKTIILTPEEAYGHKDSNLVHTIDRKNFKGKEIKVGTVLGMTMSKDGQEHQIPATVIAVMNNKIKVDFNHPLAGQELTYQITLQTISQTPLPINSGSTDSNEVVDR